jgi:hypothetical protein
MFCSISISQNPAKFQFFKYKSKDIVVDGHSEGVVYDLELKTGDIFGLLETKTKWYLAEPHEFDKRKPFKPVTVSPHDARRLIDNSDEWAGKVAGVMVTAGPGKKSAIEAEKQAGKAQGLLHLKVNSSNISRALYSKKQKELFIVFRSGATYKYSNVPPRVALEFEASKSQGNYFLNNIRDEYETTRLDSIG